MMLALGAVMNFGVMVWCVWRFSCALDKADGNLMWSGGPSDRGLAAKRIEALPTHWSVDVPPDWPSPDFVKGGDFGWLYLTQEIFEGKGLNPDRLCWISRTEAGWPMRCWWGAEGCLARAPATGGYTRLTARAVKAPDAMRTYFGPEWYPIGIHPLPFIANTLFYAALPMGVWLAIGPVRRWRRRRAGRCPACGYDRAGLAASAVCPECGHAPAAPKG
jgi:hypothetical protein